MKANKTHISLKTAKLLKDCGVVATQYFTKYFDKDGTETAWELLPPQILPDKYETSEFYPAYTWQEILWEYPEEFFGEENRLVFTIETTHFMQHEIQQKFIPNATAYILDLLQVKKYEEADLYFRDNCVLIKK